jgi:uncharacterized protein YndB with AHSA1/START domain
MREVTVSKIISADREAIFDLVSDLASRPAYADHYMRDYRLARVNPVGEGAAARFQVKKPFAKEYAELQLSEVDRPRRIVETIALGRRGRNRFLAVYDFSKEAAGVTRVELTTYGEPATFSDRLKQIERLRMIFEEPGKAPLKRATIAGYEPSKAARFGAPPGTDPARMPPH